MRLLFLVAATASGALARPLFGPWTGVLSTIGLGFNGKPPVNLPVDDIPLQPGVLPIVRGPTPEVAHHDFLGYHYYEQPPMRQDWNKCDYNHRKNHRCLMMPNGYAATIWEGYHTREQCVLPWNHHTEGGEMTCNENDMCVRDVKEENVAFCVSRDWLKWDPKSYAQSYWFGKKEAWYEKLQVNDEWKYKEWPNWNSPQ